MKLQYDSKYFMGKAIEQAEIALSKGEIPIGAVTSIPAKNKRVFFQKRYVWDE